MIVQRRIGLFETNSSSSHSIHISTMGEHNGKLNCIDGKIYSRGDEFGWGYEIFTDAQTKLDYLITHLFSRYDKQEDVDMAEAANPYYLMIKRVVEGYTGCELVLVPIEEQSGYWPFGYIDHQSYGEANEALVDEDTIADFIFNPNSELVIDNDNRY